MEENCPFCIEIEPKSRIIKETGHTLVILSNPALVKGHCLILPKRHIEKLIDLRNYELNGLFWQIISMEELLLKKFGGCDIKQNYRPFQKEDNLKVNHLHFHLQPREFEDELYKKCQIYEKEIFRNLNQEDLDEIKNYILN